MMTSELLERQQYETLHGMAEQARKQTPHIRPDEWRAAGEGIRGLAEQGRRLDGAPASASIYGVGGGMTAAAVAVKKRPMTMEEFIAQLEREGANGGNEKAENFGEYAGDAGKAARQARGDGEGQTPAGGDRERWLRNREAGAYDRRRAGRPKKISDEQRAAIMREYIETGRSCRQIAKEYGVNGQTVLRILGELQTEAETMAKRRLRLRDEAIIAEWRKGTLTSEIVKITGVSDGTVRRVITQHRKATGEAKPQPQHVGG